MSALLDVPIPVPTRPPRSDRRPSSRSNPSPVSSNHVDGDSPRTLTPPSGSDGNDSENEPEFEINKSSSKKRNLFNVPLPSSYIPDRQSSLILRPEAKPSVPSRQSSLTPQQKLEQEQQQQSSLKPKSYKSSQGSGGKRSIWQTLRRTSTQSNSLSPKSDGKKRSTLSLFSFPRRAISSSSLKRPSMTSLPTSPTSISTHGKTQPQPVPTRFSSIKADIEYSNQQIPTINEDPNVKDIKDEWEPIQAWLSNSTSIFSNNSLINIKIYLVETVKEEGSDGHDESRATFTTTVHDKNKEIHDNMSTKGFMTDDATDYSLREFTEIEKEPIKHDQGISKVYKDDQNDKINDNNQQNLSNNYQNDWDDQVKDNYQQEFNNKNQNDQFMILSNNDNNVYNDSDIPIKRLSDKIDQENDNQIKRLSDNHNVNINDNQIRRSSVKMNQVQTDDTIENHVPNNNEQNKDNLNDNNNKEDPMLLESFNKLQPVMLEENKRLTLSYGDILSAQESDLLMDQKNESVTTLNTINEGEKLNESVSTLNTINENEETYNNKFNKSENQLSPETQVITLPEIRSNRIGQESLHSPYSAKSNLESDTEIMTVEDSLQGFHIDNDIGQAY